MSKKLSTNLNQYIFAANQKQDKQSLVSYFEMYETRKTDTK